MDVPGSTTQNGSATLGAMNLASIGAVVSRGAGVVLLVTGVAPLLGLLPGNSSGWVNYGPGAAPVNPVSSGLQDAFLHDTFFIVTSIGSACAPMAIQIAAGIAMILFPRLIGRWLARGLDQGVRETPPPSADQDRP